MKVFTHIFLFAILVVSPLRAETEILGRLGDMAISVEEVRAALTHLDANQAEAVRKDAKILEDVVRAFLVQKLVLNEALEKKWDQRPEIVAKLARARDSTLTESYLETLAQPPPDYPAEDDLKAAYDRQRSSFLMPRSFRLAQIFIAEGRDAEAKLGAVKKELRSNKADFAAIAGRLSEDAVSAGRGGEIGWLTESQIQPEIRTQISGVKLFAASDPIRLKDGWHILKVLDAREPYTPTLEQMRAQLTRQMRAEKLRGNSQAHLAELLKKHPVSLDASALQQVLPKGTE